MTAILSGTVTEVAEKLSKLVIQGHGNAIVVVADPLDPRRVAKVDYVETGELAVDETGGGEFSAVGVHGEAVPAVRIGC